MTEERIAIKVVSDPCDGCPKEYMCKNDCISKIIYKNWGNGIPRQEAIEKISGALYEAGLKEGCNYYAEAALNALLEGK